jgi:hypothetical protein
LASSRVFKRVSDNYSYSLKLKQDIWQEGWTSCTLELPENSGCFTFVSISSLSNDSYYPTHVLLMYSGKVNFSLGLTDPQMEINCIPRADLMGTLSPLPLCLMEMMRTWALSKCCEGMWLLGTLGSGEVFYMWEGCESLWSG